MGKKALYVHKHVDTFLEYHRFRISRFTVYVCLYLPAHSYSVKYIIIYTGGFYCTDLCIYTYIIYMYRENLALLPVTLFSYACYICITLYSIDIYNIYNSF